MPSLSPPTTSLEDRIAQVAAGLASERGAASRAAPDARAYLVRMSSTLAQIIEEALPPGMPMATFLRQSAVRVALEHMERTQGS